MDRKVPGPGREQRVAPTGGHTLPASIVAERDKPGNGPASPAGVGEHPTAERLWFDDAAHNQANGPSQNAAMHNAMHNAAVPKPTAQNGAGRNGPGQNELTVASPHPDAAHAFGLSAVGPIDVAGPGTALARPGIEAYFTPPPLPDVSGDAGPTLPQARVLVRICEPLFQRVCRLNRLKRAGFPDGPLRAGEVRDDLEQVLERVLASTVPRHLSRQLEALGLPLRCFLDLLMTRGGFGFEEPWEPLAPGAAGTHERSLVDAVTAALSDAVALEQLEVLQVCLCFSAHLIEPTPVQRPVAPLLQQVRNRLSSADEPRFCPTAYEGVFTRTVLTPVGSRLRLLAGVSAAVLLLAVAGAVALNWYYSRQMDGSINTVRAALEAPPESPGQ